MTSTGPTDALDALDAALSAELPAAAALRERLHADPRLSGQESDTAAVVADAIGAGGGVEVAGTGRLIRVVDGSPLVVLRAELDGLPVVERTGAPFASRSTVMHACGHDIHLAAAVAVARAVRATGPAGGAGLSVLLQPREEQNPSGARDIVAAGVLAEHGTDVVIGAHVQPQLPGGVIGVTPGLVNASVDEFEIVVNGRGGHAGYPHTVRDPVLALCQIVVALQQIASRRIDPVHGAVCTVGRIEGGTASNVVPDHARAIGTIRLMRQRDRDAATELIRSIAEHTAEAFGCTAAVAVHVGEPALDNDIALATRTAAVLRDAGYAVADDFRSFGADDFSYYGAGHPSLMCFVGVESDAGLHEPTFLPGPEVLPLVAAAYLHAYRAAGTADVQGHPPRARLDERVGR